MARFCNTDERLRHMREQNEQRREKDRLARIVTNQLIVAHNNPQLLFSIRLLPAPVRRALLEYDPRLTL